MNIVCGLILIAAIAAKMLNLVDLTVFRIIALVVIAVMLIIYLMIRNSCKNMK